MTKPLEAQASMYQTSTQRLEAIRSFYKDRPHGDVMFVVGLLDDLCAVTVSETDRELALEWAESSGQRREVCERSNLPEALRSSYHKMSVKDMAKARAYLKLPDTKKC